MLHMHITDQIDFIYFVYGIAFLLMAVVCASLHKQESLLPWKLLALFGLTHGIHEWMEMLPMGMGDSTVFAMARLALMSVSFIFLLEFSRRATSASQARAVWLLFILCLSLLIAFGVQEGLPGINAAVRYGMAMPGGLWAGLALLRAGRRQHHGSVCLSLAGGAMMLYGLAAGLVTPAASMPPASFINNDTFLSFMGFPVQLMRCVLAGALVCAFWIRYETNRMDMQPRHHAPVVFALALLVLLGAGWSAAQWMGERENARRQATILDLAQRTALAISPEHVNSLAGSRTDLENQSYQRLKEQLKTLCASMQQIRFLYLMRLFERRIVFLADSEPAGSKDESLPGDVYEDYPPGLAGVFVSGNTYIAGPFTDRWGTWVSGFAPVRDRRSGRLVAVLGVDQDARMFRAAVEAERLKAIGLTALFCFALLLSFVCRRRFREALMQPRLDLASDLLLRCGTTGIVVLIGSALALTAFMENRYDAHDLFVSAFRQQAALQAEVMSLELVRQMDDLDGLRRYLESDDFVDRNEFVRYVGPIKEQFPVQAVEWIPRVQRGERTHYEAIARQDGLTEFRFTEKNSDGRMIPAQERDDYYPVYYVEPLKGNDAALGFDLASEPLRRAAMGKACDQGRAAGTAPVRLVQETGSQTGFLVFSPVYGGQGIPRTVEQRRLALRGFVLGVYRTGDLMQGVLASLPGKGLPFQLEDLSAPSENRLLHNCMPQAGNAFAMLADFKKQMDIASRDWRITIVPDADFVKNNLSRSSWLILAGGMLLTALFTLYMNNLVTGRFRAEDLVRWRTAQLQEQRQQLEDVIVGTRIGTWQLNIQTGAFIVNQCWAEIIGDRVDELSPLSLQRVKEMVHPEDLPRFMQALNDTLQGLKPLYECEYRIHCRDGCFVWVQDMGRIMQRSTAGEPLRMSGTHADINDRRESERVIKETLSDLKRSNTELENFAYVASHDMQEPLRMVVSYLQLLARRYKDRLDADADEFIGYAVDGAQRMQTLINDLLAYSRVGTKGKPFAQTDCNDAVKRALANLEVSLSETGARIDSAKLPTVSADSSQLVQLFQNLVGNALKYRSPEPPRIGINAELRQHEWIFSVQDNGIGIEPRYFERIFVIFQRLHSRSEHSGTGIGLSVCKKIVERHGGIIWVSSEPGTGSTFYFTLPAVEGV